MHLISPSLAHRCIAARIVVIALAVLVVVRAPASAGNHGDSPAVQQDTAAAIGDLFFFLDPNDNTKAIIACTVHGFIVPSYNQNLGFFDPGVRLRFQIENTGDYAADAFIDVTFAARTSRTVGQTATIKLPNGHTLQAPCTVSTSASGGTNTVGAANPPVVTSDPISGVSFFAGLTDDPFFFDLPAALKYVVSRQANATDPSLLTRGRDSFAGYNINTVALRVPVSMIRGLSTNHVVGLCAYAQRPQTRTRASGTGFSAVTAVTVKPATPAVTPALVVNSDGYVTVDRMGVPGINAFLTSRMNKDAYNRASTVDDGTGVFANDIVSNLEALQTDATSIGILLNLVVKGDMLRLDLNIANTGLQGGSNPEAAFPNGRRPIDQVMTTLFTLINNRVFQDVGVDANDLPFRNSFPFFAAAEVPFPAGTVDDRTRN